MEKSQPLAAVVTGSSGGLGAATARALSDAGYQVHGFDIGDVEDGDQRIVRHKVDVADDASVAAAFEDVAVDAEIAVVVHCAGIASFGPKTPGQLIDPEGGHVVDNFGVIERVLRTNLLGSFSVARHAAVHMSRRTVAEGGQRGVIILTSSGAATDGKAGQSAYSASKAGVIGMTLPLARELGQWGRAQ